MQKEIDVSIATEPTEEHIAARKQARPLENNGVYTELSDNLKQQSFEVNNSNGVQEQTVQLESIIAEQEQSTSSNNASVENTEVVRSGSSSTQSGQTTTTSNENLSREVTYGHLERIWIPTFAGDKMKYQQWNAAFTSCVDKTMLTHSSRCFDSRHVYAVKPLTLLKALDIQRKHIALHEQGWKGSMVVPDGKSKVI